MLETDEELSDLSDSDFEDIMNATDVLSDEELLSDLNENLKERPQPDPDTAGPSAPKKRPRRPRPNNVKYNELCWTSTELPQPMRRYLFDEQPGVNNVIVQSCDPLEIFEVIVTDEIVDHIVT